MGCLAVVVNLAQGFGEVCLYPACQLTPDPLHFSAAFHLTHHPHATGEAALLDARGVEPQREEEPAQRPFGRTAIPPPRPGPPRRQRTRPGAAAILFLAIHVFLRRLAPSCLCPRSARTAFQMASVGANFSPRTRCHTQNSRRRTSVRKLPRIIQLVSPPPPLISAHLLTGGPAGDRCGGARARSRHEGLRQGRSGSK